MLQSLVIQNLIVAAVVLTAAVMLLLRASKYFRSAPAKSGCGAGCGSCPNREAVAAAPPKLLQLESSNRRQ